MAPALVGCVLVGRRRRATPDTASPRMLASSTLFCTLAFNLMFLWQEVWLVLPKAIVPGLHPVLFHNDHEWTGDSPYVELLQGTGALATGLTGLGVLLLLRSERIRSGSWRLFCFWLTFQGLNQSLTQLALGALLPQNDVGRALTFIGLEGGPRHLVLAVAVALLALAGLSLARVFPGATDERSDAEPRDMVVPGLASILLVAPFRVPRSPIEVVLVPALVIVVGLGWLIVGSALKKPAGAVGPTSVVVPALALVATLAAFQLLLRPGLAF